MNTLLGQLATYNDILYPRYRFAFKLRTLQVTFLFHQLDLKVLQDVFCTTGIQSLPRDEEVTETQLSTVISEIFSTFRSSLQSDVDDNKIEGAHTTCFNWLLMAFMTGDHTKRIVGVLQTILILFSGSKTEDKAKYLFELLERNGAVGLDDLQFFCESIELLASSLQESVYPDIQSTEQLEQAMLDCLSYVQRPMTIEMMKDSKPWLSLFDFVKVFTASPPLKFLSWLNLWDILLNVEEVIHPVKCKICNKKRFRGFRYQCEVCSSCHMCQMCFLKGRTADNHGKDHKVLECQDYTITLRTRLGLSHSTSKVYRVMDEPQDMHVQICLSSVDLADSTGLQDFSPFQVFRSPLSTPEPGRRSAGGSPYFDSRKHRVSYISTSSSDIDDNECCLEQTPIPRTQKIERSHHFNSVPRRYRPRHKNGRHHAANKGMTSTYSLDDISKKCENENLFSDINKRLSHDVYQLLQDLASLDDSTTGFDGNVTTT